MSICNRIARTLVPGVLAACFAYPAQATVNVIDLAPGDTLTFGNAHTGSFTDIVGFNLRDEGPLTATVTATGVTGFLVTLTDDKGDMVPTPGAIQTGSQFSLALPGLKNDRYNFNISGVGGSYTGSVSATMAAATPPVPEPEIWAMMAIGAGLVGFQVRRRQKKTAAPSLSLT